MKITEFEITNFKAFGETVTIPIRPITLIFGQNSSGKSSIFHALNLLKQSIKKSDRYFYGLKNNGSIIELGEYRDFVHDNDENSSITFSFIIKLDDTSSIEEDFRYSCTDYNGTDDSSIHPIINRMIEFISKFETAKIEINFSKNNINFIKLYINNHREPVLEYGDEFSFNYDLKWFWMAYWIYVHKCDTNKIRDYLKRNYNKDIPYKHIEINSNDDEERILESYNNAIDYFKLIFDWEEYWFTKHVCFVPVEFAYFSLHQIIFESDYSIDEIRFHPAVLLWVMLKKVEEFINYGKYIGPLRDFPKFHYEYSDTNLSYVGSKGDNFSNILYGEIISRKNRKLNNKLHEEKLRLLYKNEPDKLSLLLRLDKSDKYVDIIDKTNNNLKLIGSDYYIKVAKLYDGRQKVSRVFSVILVNRYSNKPINLKNLGFGFSQILPIIIQCSMSNHSNIIIEQPELHIHPAWQANMGDIFINSSCKKNIRDSNSYQLKADRYGLAENKIFLETHSEHLILRILRRIRETTRGTLPKQICPVMPEDVSVIYVKPGKKGSEIVLLPINNDGDFDADWPDGFFEEREKELFD